MHEGSLTCAHPGPPFLLEIDAHDLVGLAAAGVTTSTVSPTVLPISARAIGDVIETRPDRTSASGSPTIW